MKHALERIISQPFKNLRLMLRSPFRFLEVSVWPLTFLFLFIFMVQSFDPKPKVLEMVIMAMAGWQAVHHAQMGIGTTYMDEYWSQSLAHLFISPLRLTEFVIGGILTGLAKLAIVLVLFLVTVFFFYGIWILDWASFLIALFFLFLFGVSIGMLNLSAMFLFGENAISLVWTTADIFVVLSGVYYSVSILPKSLQLIAGFLPSLHAFNLLKSTVEPLAVDWVSLSVLSLAWLAGSFAVLKYAFFAAKKTGKLVRVA
ncbi:MAG: ABC transporter permease [Candidatus Diapherotrites archaeon]|nr:ABC transporter permease [Candidatus Diapherotrites archaeon]